MLRGYVPGDGACGDGVLDGERNEIKNRKWRIPGLFARLASSEKPCEKLGFLIGNISTFRPD